MNAWRTGQGLIATLLWFGTSVVSAQTTMQRAEADLAGTSWQLIIFQGPGDKNLIPDERSKYTIDFAGDGQLNTRIDCSVGHGTWSSPGPSQLRFGPLAFTSECASGSLHDQIVRDWTDVRMYVIKNGRLFLSVTAPEGNLYAFERAAEREPAAPTLPVAVTPTPLVAVTPTLPVAFKGPVQYQCKRPGRTETLKVTFYQTAPAMVVIERGNQTRSAFLVSTGNDATYQGDDLVFSDVSTGVNINWSGTEFDCKPS